jgi:hypothetical protein
MPYPPSNLPTNRTNTTQSADNHPGDHNDVNTAVNDIVTELGTNPSGSSTDVTTRLGLAIYKDVNGNITFPSGTFSSGTLTGGNLLHVTHIIADNTYTQTAVPADEILGSFFNAKWNVILNYTDGNPLIGPLIQSEYFGPRGVFNIEGVATYNYSTGIYGISPISFLSVMTQKNASGSALSLTPAWTYVASNFYLADAATVTVQNNDTLNGPSPFIDTSVYGSGGTGHYDGGDNYFYSYVSKPAINGHVTFAGRVAFEVREFSATQGGAGGTLTLADGSSFTFDTTNYSITEQIGLRIEMLTKATANKAIEIGAGNNTLTSNPTGGATTGFINFLSGTTTLNFTNAIIGPMVGWNGTLEYQQTGNVFGSARLFSFTGTIKNKAGTTANPGLVMGYLAQPTYQADTGTVSMGNYYGVFSSLNTSVINGGIISGLTVANFVAHGGNIGTSTTITTRRGFLVQDASPVNGTLSTQVGLEIDALIGGTINIGIRNASTIVYTPTVGTISVASSTIPATASVIRLNNTSGGAITLTSAPTIADGQDGQTITIFNGSTNNVVIQDQGTLASSNLRLAATTRTLGTRDSITLTYSNTVGDWIEIGYTNVL